jgi:hypothetical protein
MQQALKPGEQMWVNVADLIRNRVADRKGNLLPVDLSTGTYELRDLGASPGALMMASVTSDSSTGIGLPSAECCGIQSPSFDPDFFAVEIDGMWDPFATVATEACSGQRTDISSEMISFWATNTAIAQVTSGKLKGLAVGTTTANGESDLVWVGQGNNCILKQETTKAQVTVQQPTSLSVLSVTVLPNGQGLNFGCPPSTKRLSS